MGGMIRMSPCWQTPPSKTTGLPRSANTTIQVPVVDLYDPTTDTTIALENARKVFPLYPMSAIRETGPGWDDWDVCTVGGEAAPASEAPLPRNDNLDEAQHWRDFCAVPGCAADTRVIRTGAGGPGGSALDCLDIQAAAADPNVNVPAENYWTHIDRSHNRYPYSNPLIDYTIIGDNGQTQSHKLFLFGGTHPTGVGDPFQGTTGRLVETIELSDGNGGPACIQRGRSRQDLSKRTSASHALALPDGNILAAAAAARVRPENLRQLRQQSPSGVRATLRVRYMRGPQSEESDHLSGAASYCSPGRKEAGCGADDSSSRRDPRGLSSTAHGEPLQSAYDRAAISRIGNRQFTPGDADLATNSSQIFTPPYLYDSSVPCPTSVGCKLAKRPVITKAPTLFTTARSSI